jgi:hypothetical protein
MGKHRDDDADDDSGKGGGGKHREQQTCWQCGGYGSTEHTGDGTSRNSAVEIKKCDVCNGTGYA